MAINLLHSTSLGHLIILFSIHCLEELAVRVKGLSRVSNSSLDTLRRRSEDCRVLNAKADIPKLVDIDSKATDTLRAFNKVASIASSHFVSTDGVIATFKLEEPNISKQLVSKGNGGFIFSA